MTVDHIPTEVNPADLFTKVLSRTTFEKHRAFVMNTAAARAEDKEAAREQPAVP